MVSNKSILARTLVPARSSNTALERLRKGPPILRRPFQWHMKKSFWNGWFYYVAALQSTTEGVYPTCHYPTNGTMTKCSNWTTGHNIFIQTKTIATLDLASHTTRSRISHTDGPFPHLMMSLSSSLLFFVYVFQITFTAIFLSLSFSEKKTQ